MPEQKIMLITYADSLGRDIRQLHDLLNTYFREAVRGVHLLPFFPSSGDRGFAVKTYREVDPAFGTWADVTALARDYDLMADYMINHISARSEYYQDFLQRHEASPWKDLFLRYGSFWPGGAPTQAQVDAIYKRKPRAPSVTAHFADGTTEEVWCTFDEEQIDLDWQSPTGQAFLRDNLTLLCEKGLRMIRLDAFAYATKEAGTSCFFREPQVWQLLEAVDQVVKPWGAMLLPEIHEHYTMQLKLAAKGYPVYDFALPMLLLHALYFGQSQYLRHWLEICPRRQFTTLDTHDGIGVVDVRDLLPEEEIERTKDGIFRFGANVKRVYNTAAYNNLDIYQVNCTYYSALGEEDESYLIARAVQFFAPGTPQVYYVGMLAGRNDLELLERTKVGRNINRHYYDAEEIAREVQRPVVARLLHLMRFRNQHPAFEGEFLLLPSDDEHLHIRRENGPHAAELTVDFARHRFEVTATGPTGELQPVIF